MKIKITLAVIAAVMFLLINPVYSADPVLISEVFYDSPLNESHELSQSTGMTHHNGEFIELFNPTMNDICLKGWKISDSNTNYYLPDNAIIPSRSTVVIAYRYPNSGFVLSNLFPSISSIPETGRVFYQSDIELSNNGEYIRLINPSGTTVDQMSYKYPTVTGKKADYWNISAKNYNWKEKVERNYCSLQRTNFEYNSVVFTASVSHYSTLQPTPLTTPTGINFTVINDNPLITEPSTDNIFDPTLPVGAIPGQFDVSPTGAATYNIPIDVPVGVNGVQPKLSISYNSQSGFGLFGLGWNVSGLSAITRGSKSQYFDNKNEYIKIDNTDPIYLDGQRLIYLFGGSGNLTDGATYGTEIEDYSRIVYNGSSFILTTLDGKVLEYGNTNDSKLKNAGDANDTRIFSWKLNKLTDNYGNSMKYTYTQNGQYISKINYTYNQNSNSGQEIEFVYQTNSFNPRIYNIQTFKIINDKLLQNINLKCNNSSVITYTFSYTSDNRLKTVGANVSDGSKIGNKKIEWGGATENQILKTTINSPSNAYMGFGGSSFTGDVNGDGYPDWIQMLAGETGELVIYLFSKTTNSYMSPTKRSLYYCSSCNVFKPKLVVGDIDNDGKDEILIYNYNNLNKFLSIFKYSDDLILYDFNTYHNLQTHLNLMNEFEIPDITLPDYKFFKAYVNNDQYNDIVFAMTDGYYIYYGSEIGITSTNVKKLKFDNGTKIYEGDFDADKKIDILGITNGGNYQSLGDNEFSYVRSNLWDNVLTNKRRIFPVDFNGDGLCDIMFQNKEDKNYSWGIAYNTGGFNSNPQIINLPNLHPSVPSKPNEDDFETPLQYMTKRHDIAIPIDYNGDGLMDFVIADEKYDTPIYKDVCDFYFLGCWSSHKEIDTYIYSYTTWFFYKNVNGKTFELEKQFNDNTAVEYSMSKEDMNGDGITDLAFQQVSGFKAFSKFEANRQNLVSSIKNSNNFGNYNTIQYKNLSDFEAYNTSEAKLTIRPLRKPIIVVDGYNNPIDEYTCSYEKPVIHIQGKGFLGFKTIKERNAELGKFETITDFEINSNYCLLNQVNKTIKGGQDIISSTTLSNNTLTSGEKRYIPIITNYSFSDKSRNLEIYETIDYNDYPNSITQTQTIGDLTNKTKTEFEYLIDVNGKQSLIPFLPKIVTSTSTQNNNVCTRTLDYSYNNNGSVIKKISDKDKEGQFISEYPKTDFDKFGHPLTTKYIAKDANGIDQTRIAKVTYTQSGRFIDSRTNFLDEKTLYEWNENIGRIKSSTDAYGRITSFTYDVWGQLLDTKYPNNIHKTQFMKWGSPSTSVNFQGSYYLYSQVSGQTPVITYFKPNGDRIQTESYGLNGGKILVNYSEGFMDENDFSRFSKVSDPYFEKDNQPTDNSYYYDNFERIKLIETPLSNTTITYTGPITTLNSTKDGVLETKINNAGQVEYNSINGKKVNYTYYPSGLMHTATPDGGLATSMEYDLQGRRTKLSDPHLGIIESRYNGFGELVWEKQKIHTNKPDIITTYNYNSKGVLQNIIRNNEITNYSYDNHNRIDTIQISGKNKQSFTYDDFDRVTNVREFIGLREFNTETIFDALGRVKKEIYPSGFFTENTFDDYSNLVEVKDRVGNSIWKVNEENARGQLTSITKGGNKIITYGFDSRGFPVDIVSTGLVNMEYYFNPKGNLEYREDKLTHQKEQFVFDDFNRLTNWDIYQNGSGTAAQKNEIGYNSAGNIENKTDLGSFTLCYDGKQANQSVVGTNVLTSIIPKPGSTGLPTNMSASNLSVSYTDFSKIYTLNEGSKNYEITYGVDDQRRKTVFKCNGQEQTKYYLGNYEEELTSDGNIRKIHYLAGAIYVDNSIKSDSLYYVFTDHEGSVIALTDNDWNIKRNYAYDPWGARRNPIDWTRNDNGNGLIIDRGYTGHEHIDAFGIINMNGRVYDPATAQFFSPDPFINEADNWLSYNRYAYCKGNPLYRIDPSGYSDVYGGRLRDVDCNADYTGYFYENSYNSSDSWENTGEFNFDGHPTDNAGIIIQITGPNLLSQNNQTTNLTSLPTPVVGVNVISFSMPMTTSYLKGLLNGINSVGKMIQQPVKTLNYIGNAILHPVDTYNAFNDLSYDFFDSLISGDGEKFAYYTGNFLGTFAGVELTGGAFNGIVTATRGAEIANVAAKGGFDAVGAFKNAISPFKGGNLTNAGRAVTKHPEYFGFESTEALMKVYRSPSALNNLGSSTLKDILRNGVRTTGAGGRYPKGWVTYTLPNGNAASWGLDGTFIGFRGIK